MCKSFTSKFFEEGRTLILVLVLLLCTAASAFAAPGDTTQNQPSLSSYDTPEYAEPVVDTSGNHTLTITNTHEPEVVDVIVTKIWDDDDNRDNLRPDNICVTLTAAANDGAATGEVYNYTLSTSDADANDDNQWSHTFEDLVKFYDGYQIAYTVAEADGTCPSITYTQTNCVLSGGKWENSACTTRASGDGNTHASPNTYTDQAICEAAGFEWFVDEDYTECYSEDPEDYTTQSDCELVEGYWYNNQCNWVPGTQAECEDENYYWYNNQCNEDFPETRPDCEEAEYYWYGDTCNTTIPTTRSQCEIRNLYWYDNKCNTDLPSTRTDCETKGFYWYNNQCNINAPTTQAECEAVGYYWHADLEPAECLGYPTPDTYTTKEDCENSGHDYVWHGDYCGYLILN